MVGLFPFEETLLVDKEIPMVLRTFRESISEEELLWHWDEEDRIIIPTHKTDWKFQMDNELPKIINGEIRISSGSWHRLIKGSGDLILQIIKIKK